MTAKDIIRPYRLRLECKRKQCGGGSSDFHCSVHLRRYHTNPEVVVSWIIKLQHIARGLWSVQTQTFQQWRMIISLSDYVTYSADNYNDDYV